MEELSAVAIVSGGLDSTTMLYSMVAAGIKVKHALSFNYGQKHKKELKYAMDTCAKLGVHWDMVDLWFSGLPGLLSKSASSLISDTAVPEGHYGEESMKQTVVPNRNMMMLSIAGAVAVADEAHSVWIGVHTGDHFIYPDCRPAFIEAASEALAIGNEGFGSFVDSPIITPFATATKADIAYDAMGLGVPFEETWSCYLGGDYHCGRCGTCVERLEAIDAAQRRWVNTHDAGAAPADLTIYGDRNYWREALKRETV